MPPPDSNNKNANNTNIDSLANIIPKYSVENIFTKLNEINNNSDEYSNFKRYVKLIYFKHLYFIYDIVDNEIFIINDDNKLIGNVCLNYKMKDNEEVKLRRFIIYDNEHSLILLLSNSLVIYMNIHDSICNKNNSSDSVNSHSHGHDDDSL